MIVPSPAVVKYQRIPVAAYTRVIGHVKKKWSGLLKEAFTDADNFEVEFVADIDPRWKAVALAAAVLIDVIHFERAKNA